jgi:hypothetical protein
MVYQLGPFGDPIFTDDFRKFTEQIERPTVTLILTPLATTDCALIAR